jgi:phage-related protein
MPDQTRPWSGQIFRPVELLSQKCDNSKGDGLMDIVVLPQCKKEIDEFPLKVREDLLDAISDLKAGVILSMPLSRKMEGMGVGVFELRFKERSGIYRVIYFIKKSDAIYLIHGFQKKTNKTPQRNIEVSLQRIKRFV